MKIIENFLKLDPYSLDKKNKLKKLLFCIARLTHHHYKNCKIYNKIVTNLNFNTTKKNKLEDFPMMPVRIFKKYDLFSIPKNKIVKKINNSPQYTGAFFFDEWPGFGEGNQSFITWAFFEEILINRPPPVFFI